MNFVQCGGTSLALQAPRSRLLRQHLLGILGNAMKWVDFALEIEVCANVMYYLVLIEDGKTVKKYAMSKTQLLEQCDWFKNIAAKVRS
jgi:hypothetical protein